MTTHPKPLLTRRDIEASKTRSDLNPAWCRTIEAMAELLERWQNSQTPTTRMLISRQELESLWMETNQIVQAFNATEGEGSCLPESK